MKKMNNEELNNLLGIAKKKLEKAAELLNVYMKSDTEAPNENVKAGLDAIRTYTEHAAEIISWINKGV